ncbi:hypothetical protein E3N88_02472 [Mikania micrantha]|uniref:Terpene synthase N-terminal domain-containing protein n=1 Tax=Mikania micrantha TaxID=192012 RepID=A0A5N6Q5M4_9ASTR|nr:hypothetical protein E3N88_02472 [Mikania micrantha]
MFLRMMITVWVWGGPAKTSCPNESDAQPKRVGVAEAPNCRLSHGSRMKKADSMKVANGGDLFKATLDKQLFELNSRFNEQAMELLSLSSSLVSKEINVNQICLLVEKYYPEDFTEHEKLRLRERGFSAMKIFKNRLRNKMSDEYLSDSLLIYIEKEIAEKFDLECIINEFKELKGRRAEL